ncbi:hypothetical protein AOZ06_10780 [Kibdelosporangium phytohabitans]|uniref:SWIM-type domain-containing protein n=1 Tax=Kibdelosporangium phytohabitans TaxID=860235 RepID=A0A0N9HV08_9PSEU|nr:hypothetical protein AOZ06_10780 [Kibdelosporangium phytohabitans]
MGPDLARIGREHLDQGRVFELGEDDGGVVATVLDSGRREYDVWVGVVNGQLTGECDCKQAEASLCGHAVAVTLAALEDGIPFTSVTEQDDDDEDRFAELAAGLTFDQLVDLVARQAVADPDFADELIALTEDDED